MDINKERINVKYEIVLEYEGIPIVDSKLASLLKLIDRKGSLLSAARSLGIPYSRAWEMIMKVERILGKPLIIAHRGGRGGGGTKLTETSKKLLEIYVKAESKLYKYTGYRGTRKYISLKEPDVIIAYSHDPLLEIILGKLENKGYSIDGLCIGSGMALATLSLGEADIACIHLFDPEKRTYNKPYIEKYWLTNRVIPLGGYMRELVFALKPGLKINSLEELLIKLINGELKLVNRNRGSGTRVYLDYLLSRTAMKIGKDLSNIRGYENEVYTHIESAKQVAMGKADTSLMLRYAADLYGLEYIHVTWEVFECIALIDRLSKEAVREFRILLNSEEVLNLINKMHGYRHLP
ncbi:MAG: hypothetical protein DRO40_06560 [Thermoprotei archaeon]|nr:MAG: hypothetical protein DRO40_06560 [Thermoprotei archaeon]